MFCDDHYLQVNITRSNLECWMIIDVITGLFYLIHAWDRIRVHHQHITQLLTGNPLNAYRYYSDVQRREKKNRPGFYGQGGLNPIITAECNC